MTVPFRKIKQEIEIQQHIYAEYDYCKAISPNIFVLVSAGLDSMFLLDFMSRCNVRFDVIHFVHGIRSPEQSMADLALIHNTVLELNKTRAEDRQITVRVGYGEGLSEGSNIEARAHKQRWDFVDSQRDRIIREFRETDYYISRENDIYGAPGWPGVLAITAHHLNDNIEHTLMSLMRGKPHDQLSMREMQFMHFSANRFKPLLQVPKRVIQKMAEIRGLEWNEDDTNSDNNAERNWMRNVIIPQLMERRNLEKSMAEGMTKYY